MFPLNKEIFFSSILSTVEQEKTKDISPKACMCQQLHLFLQQGNRFRLKNIDTFEENVVTFLNLQQ